MDIPKTQATLGTQDTWQINVREIRRGNQEWTKTLVTLGIRDRMKTNRAKNTTQITKKMNLMWKTLLWTGIFNSKLTLISSNDSNVLSLQLYFSAKQLQSLLHMYRDSQYILMLDLTKGKFRVTDCCQLSNFQPYHGENKLIFNDMMMRTALY